MMLERKLIRHPYGHEEILIVDGAVLRPHDMPKTGLTVFTLAQMMFGAIPELAVVFQDICAEKQKTKMTEVMTVKEWRSRYIGTPALMG